MELFRAHELMALVIGNENYDWDAFEQSAKYKGGYTSGDPTVCVMHSTTSNFCHPLFFSVEKINFPCTDSLILGSFS